MKLAIGNVRIFEFAGDVHQRYPQMIWEVTLDYDEELLPELLLDDIWSTEAGVGMHDRQRLLYNNKSIILNKFKSSFSEKIKQQILERVWNCSSCHSGCYILPLEHYLEKSTMGCSIFKDTPGFSMVPHVDNHHVITQLIINLQDNCASTKFYPFNSTNPFYVAPTKKYQGVIFFNTNGAIHSIDNITEDRYIFYSAIKIGVD